MLRPLVLLILLVLRQNLVRKICEVLLKGERSTLHTGAVCRTITPHGFAWDKTRASAVRRQGITARNVVGVNYT
jgi:hypothetical protein